MADSPLTNRQIIQKPDIVVNPNFAIPPGIAEVVQGDERLFKPSGGNRENENGAPGGDAGEVIDVNDVHDPLAIIRYTPPPLPVGIAQNIRITSQEQRFNPDGTYVIDAILEWDDVENGVSYEVRIAKAEVGFA